MPGMKLDFLKNPSQRVATGKSLPLKQVEAIVLYGKPAQRAKVVQKLLPAVYGLSLNKTTHHILLTLLDHCDNMDRVKMLYHVRRKLLDLATSPVGNSVVQKMLDKVPLRQKKEVAEAFVLNVEEDEFKRLCEHPFGNHVAQKLIEIPECVEVVKEHFLPHLVALSLHPYGMRVVAKYVESVSEGCTQVVETLFPSYREADPAGDDEEVQASNNLDKAVLTLFRSAEESMVLTALLRHVRTPIEVKDTIYAHLSEFVTDYLLPPSQSEEKMTASAEEEEELGMPDFGTGSTAAVVDAKASPGSNVPANVHVYAAALEHGDAVQRTDLWAALSSSPALLFALTHVKGAIQVGMATVRYVEEARPTLFQVLSLSTVEEVEMYLSAATDASPVTSSPSKSPSPKKGKKSRSAAETPTAASAAVTADAIVEVVSDPVRSVLFRTFVEMARDLLPNSSTAVLTSQAVALSQNAVSSPALQKLVETDLSGEFARAVLAVLLQHPSLEELLLHPSTSFLLQSILQFAPEEVRAPLVETLSTYFKAHLHEALSFAQGSRVMQKLLAYAPDETVVNIVGQLISAATKEEEAAAEKDEEVEEDADDEESEEKERNGEEAKKISRQEQRAINKAKHYHVLSHALVSYALHNHACYVVQALLREVRARQLDRERRLLMNELKPHVFELAVSPWAGRVVLDAMIAIGSAQLADAMKNVAFLRAEEWLSEVSEERKKRGNGVDPTLRNILKRQREDIEKGVETKTPAADAVSASKEAPAHKKKKLFRSMKK